MTKKEFQPCELCGSTEEQFLYKYANPETLEVKNVCLNCLKELTEIYNLRQEKKQNDLK